MMHKECIIPRHRHRRFKLFFIFLEMILLLAHLGVLEQSKGKGGAFLKGTCSTVLTIGY